MTTEPLPTARRTVRIGDRRTLTAIVQLHKIGDQRPYFSVQGEERNLRRRGDNQIECCGCMHEDVLRVWPGLAPLVALHLSDDRGVPMHAVANAAYWLGLGDPRYVPEGAPVWKNFEDLWRVDHARAVELYNYANADPHPTAALEFLAKGEMERWQREADEGVRLIRAFQDGRV